MAILLCHTSALEPWNDARQALFESRLARLTASQGWALTWVQNVEWLDFCADFIPEALNPSRRVLGNRIIPAEVIKLRNAAQTACRGQLATVQCDGFTALNQHHLIAFMLTVNGVVYSIRAYDTSGEPKNTENLLRRIREVLQIVDKDWAVTVVAVTSDCSGESRAARAALVQEHPELVAPDCYAHQIELVVRNYFGTNAPMFSATKQADELIKWLRSRTYLLALLRDIQTSMPGFKGQPKTVIRGVVTRWTSHYLAYRRLLELQPALQLLAFDQRLFDSGTAESHAKSREMVPVIQNGLFWHSLTRIKRHLEPLAIATNTTQSNNCRLDKVVITFGSLFRFFDSLPDPEEELVKDAVLRSLEMRWGKADQDVFIAAVLLNPFLKVAPFHRVSQIFSTAAIYSLLERLWKRFYPALPIPPSFYDTVTAYLRESGEFSGLSITREAMMNAAREKNESPDPVRVWKDIIIYDADLTRYPLHRLAIHILSICPTSANCERLFSILGLIMTKLRNRLGHETLMNLAELLLHLRDEHVRRNVKARLRRHFGDQAAKQSQAESSTSGGGSSSIQSDNSEVPLTAMEALLASFSDVDMESADEDLPDAARFPSQLKATLRELLDFANPFWQNRTAATSTSTLEEELALWEILDMDADGDEVTAADARLDDLADVILNT
ncbi:hypothetical protein NUW54_g11382 [Trametes sanguinea]|uniref:Uncharacterized protein n=1 Tax=Trametes sanguinea TaxID=158606 RepID=A0ACC1NEJ1_9APHY|nr:hypothetical protein NUW54_g11382 [Trametes sanguinea]